MVQHFRPAIVLIVLMTLLTGVIYPFAIMGFANVVFPHRAGGSMIVRDGTVILAHRTEFHLG
jgi:K+-transporting ATPase ATPase C chain